MSFNKLNIESPTFCIFPDYLPLEEWQQVNDYIDKMSDEFGHLGSGDSPIRFKKAKHSRFPEIEYERCFILEDEEYELIRNGQKDEPYPESLGNDTDWKTLTHKPMEDEITDILKKTLNKSQEIIFNFFGDKTIWEYGPFLSLYGTTKSLRLHCDGFQYGIDGFPRTDYSTIYYVNDDYEGGEIYLPALGVSVKPRANSLLMWSKSWHEDMAHGVKPVISGNRYVSQGFFTSA